MRSSVGTSVCLLAVLTIGCTESEEPSVAEPVLVADHAALGFIDVSNSVVTPWCGATLVAPRVVLTASRCVANLSPSQIRFGVGGVTPQGAEGGLFPVMKVVLHPQRALWQHDLAALILETPVPNVTPMAMGPALAAAERLESVNYGYVHRGESSTRRLWAGTGQPDADSITVLPTEGAPSCQCVTGGGMVNQAGQLMGFISAGNGQAGESAPSGASCASAYRLAAVGQNLTFVDEAITASSAAPVVP
jgi:V8-like Glu-specific endopeptidase